MAPKRLVSMVGPFDQVFGRTCGVVEPDLGAWRGAVVVDVQHLASIGRANGSVSVDAPCLVFARVSWVASVGPDGRLVGHRIVFNFNAVVGADQADA